mmetsp:Transcript_29070/g.79783  ORF Transcript_29070/g.79783 Transcript_29070/m.79783 type:complete len:638 (+) Transcript_29070:586-2499(+)
MVSRAQKKNGDPPSFKAQLVTDLENTDIIMGRGNKVSTFPGNMRFRYILQPYRTPYQQTESHVEKKRIIREAFVKINGRFLDIASTNRYNANGDRVYDYYTISLERSYEKIAQALREQKWTPVTTSHTKAGKKMIEQLEIEMTVKQAPSPTSTAANKTPQVASKGPESLKKTSTESKSSPRQSSPPLPKREIPAMARATSNSAPKPRKQVASDHEEGVKEAGEAKPASRRAPSQRALKPTPKAVAAVNETGSNVAKAPPRKKKNLGVKSNPVSAKPAGGSNKKIFAENNEEIEVDLLETDVIFGRGNSCNVHPGNIRFRQFLFGYRQEYLATPTNQKKSFAYRLLNDFGGRFLEAKPGTNKYRLVELDRCTEKISQRLREHSCGRITKPDNSTFSQRPELNVKPAKVSFKADNAVTASQPETFKKRRAQSTDLSDVKKRPKTTPSALVTKPPKAKTKMTTTSKQTVATPASVGSSVASTELSSDEDSLARNGFGTDAGKALKIGSRIAVYWPMDKRYYSAIVEESKSDVPITGASPSLVLHMIRYEVDNEREWINLADHEYKVLQMKGSFESLTETRQTKDMHISLNLKKRASSNEPKKVVKIMKGGQVKRAAARRNLFLGLEGDSNEGVTEPAIIF